MTSSTKGDTRGKPAFDWVKYGGRIEKLKSMQDDPEHVDTVLITDDGSQFPVNSVVISVLGDEFTQRMMSQIKDKNIESIKVFVREKAVSLRKVTVTKVGSDSMKAVIDSCYTGQLMMSPMTVWSVVEVGEEYGMRRIIEACCEYLTKLVNEENCLEMYVVGNRKESKGLIISALGTIMRHFNSVSNHPLFFTGITFDHLNQLLSNDHLNLDDETLVWRSIKSWIKTDRGRMDSLHELITHIRYHRVPVQFLHTLSMDPLIIQANAGHYVKSMLHSVAQERSKRTFKRDGNHKPVGNTPVRSLLPKLLSSYFPLSVSFFRFVLFFPNSFRHTSLSLLPLSLFRSSSLSTLPFCLNTFHDNELIH